MFEQISIFELIETESRFTGREQKCWKMPPGPDRTKLRSRTYRGIARAMVEQWE